MKGQDIDREQPRELIAHFFRTEYGKMVATISKYLDKEPIETAEDLANDTLLAAVQHWSIHGIPPNPTAWLYKTAKNKTLNFIRRRPTHRKFLSEHQTAIGKELNFHMDQVLDDQLRMMLKCCHHELSAEIQISLMLKILCGFSISEIASALFTNAETINKRLVRGRKKLREFEFGTLNVDLTSNQDVLLKTIYLLFNEGYHPQHKNQIIRIDLCLEAIRLASILISHPEIHEKHLAHSLVALMYLNASRFEARRSQNGELIEMEKQDRALWNQTLISQGLNHLEKAQEDNLVSKYFVLASISANHCVTTNYDQTNWSEILSLYDILLGIENSPIVHLNRSIALAKVRGIEVALFELDQMADHPTIKNNYLYFATKAKLLSEHTKIGQAAIYYHKAIRASKNERDIKFLTKKLNELVPIS